MNRTKERERGKLGKGYLGVHSSEETWDESDSPLVE